jgi:hypothetical protein
MGFADVADQEIPRTSGYGFICPAQEFSLPFQYCNTDLAFNIVRMNGKFLARLEIEVQDLEVRGIMDQESLQGLLVKAGFSVELDLVHTISLQSG